MWGKLVRWRGTRQLAGAACASTSVCSLWMLGWCCVLRAWVCLLLERQRCRDGRGLTHVCAGTARERALSGGSQGASWSAHGMVRESHTLIDGSAAESAGAAEKCHSRERRHSPGSAGPPSLLTICCWNTTRTFFFHLNCLLLGKTHYLERLCTCDSDWGWLIKKKSLYILMQE